MNPHSRITTSPFLAKTTVITSQSGRQFITLTLKFQHRLHDKKKQFKTKKKRNLIGSPKRFLKWQPLETHYLHFVKHNFESISKIRSKALIYVDKCENSTIQRPSRSAQAKWANTERDDSSRDARRKSKMSPRNVLHCFDVARQRQKNRARSAPKTNLFSSFKNSSSVLENSFPGHPNTQRIPSKSAYLSEKPARRHIHTPPLCLHFESADKETNAATKSAEESTDLTSGKTRE